MKIIDEKKRLFGVLNIVDIIIIVLVIAVIFAAYTFLGKQVKDNLTKRSYSVTLEVTQVDKNLCDSIKAGKTVFDKVQNQPFGILTDFRIEPSEEYNVSTLDGSVNEVTVPERFDVYIDIEITTDRNIAVGERLGITTKDFTAAGYVVKVNKAD